MPWFVRVCARLRYRVARIVAEILPYADTEELLAAFRRTVPAGPEVLFAAKRFARVFVRRAELDGFERLLAEVRPKYLDGTDERRAAFEAWAGRFYKELHAPDACLALVGDRARDWESGLDTGLRVALWTERSNALRQQERSAEALAIAEQAQALLSPGDPDYRVLGTNVAILRRECGRPDEAARLLENLLRDAPEAERLPILESLATTLTELGRHTAALERAEELAELAARRGDDRTAV
jgi:tetratricopeptide (TPR) repeat protein